MVIWPRMWSRRRSAERHIGSATRLAVLSPIANRRTRWDGLGQRGMEAQGRNTGNETMNHKRVTGTVTCCVLCAICCALVRQGGALALGARFLIRYISTSNRKIPPGQSLGGIARSAFPSKWIKSSHGHMRHTAGIHTSYYTHNTILN